jgi:Concanavalin A-like lectin/glucanases superfamily
MNNKLLRPHLIIALLPLLAAASTLAQSSYFHAVTNLNPVGYWPMHEVGPAAPGDIETNYGSAGPLANGFYGDWFYTPSPITHGFVPGAILSDSDPAVNFNYRYHGTSGIQGSTTNCLIIPRTSPAATLIPPFTIECWYWRTNDNQGGHQADIWSSVNADGSEQGLNGSTAYAGIRLFQNNSVALYYYDGVGGGGHSTNAITKIVNQDAYYHHLVVTDDKTNITYYCDGNPEIVVPASVYGVNYGDAFEIDTGKGFTRGCSGIVDEFAIYTNALGQAEIYAHYEAGTNPAPSTAYNTLVLNDHPTIYYRMNSPTYVPPGIGTWPVLKNYGSVAANGVYTPGTIPAAVAGPNNGTVFAAGLGANTNAMPGSGMSSFADAGYSPAYAPTGTLPFTVVAWFQGAPCDSRVQTIVGQGGDTSWSLTMDPYGKLECQWGADANSLVTSARVYNDGNWHQAVEVYTPASDPNTTGTNALYVDGVLDAKVTTVSTNGMEAGTTLDVMIGTDPQYTNNPITLPNPGGAGVGTLVALGRQFQGNVCEVALFTNALTADQVQSLYNAAGMAPSIITQPVSGAVNQNSAYTNTVVANGALPLAYQWFTNGVPVAGQINANLVFDPLEPADAGDYYVVVTNNYGSVTSEVVSLTVNSSATIAGQFPVTHTNQFTLYAGASPTFSVVAGGAQPI